MLDEDLSNLREFLCFSRVLNQLSLNNVKRYLLFHTWLCQLNVFTAPQASLNRSEASASCVLENCTPVHQPQSVQQQGSNQGLPFAGFEAYLT